MKFLVALLVGASLLLSSQAQAQDISDTFHYVQTNNAPIHQPRSRHRGDAGVQRHYSHRLTVTSRARPYSRDGRPRAWCGWYMRQVKGGDPSLNLARNWASWGHATGPSVGAVVVWPHHVGYIVSVGRSGWIVRSGNWGGRVADVPLSRMPKNVIAFRS